MRLDFKKIAVVFLCLVVGMVVLGSANVTLAQTTGEAADIFGSIEKPAGVASFDQEAAGEQGEIGLLIFISNLIRVGTVIAGLWVMINFLLAGYTYISSQGDTGAHGKVKDQLTMSVLGLIIIVSAYAITAVLSTLLFGDPSFILNPTISGPGGEG